MTALAVESPSCSSRRGSRMRELVAADTERFAALAQAGRHLRQDAITDRMAAPVVDLLEIVDVEEAQRHREAVGLALSRSLCRRSWKWRWLPRPVRGSVSASRIAFRALCTERW